MSRFSDIRHLSVAFILAWFLGSGCVSEWYFGPYQLELPNELSENFNYRTFRFPLEEAQRASLRLWSSCVHENPFPEMDCRCQHPGLTSDSYSIQIDYHLLHEAGAPATPTVWLGTFSSGLEFPLIGFPDIPGIGVLAEHAHWLDTGHFVQGSFLEEELTRLQQLWAQKAGLDCHPAPIPWEILLGVRMPETEESRILVEWTVTIRR